MHRFFRHHDRYGYLMLPYTQNIYLSGMKAKGLILWAACLVLPGWGVYAQTPLPKHRLTDTLYLVSGIDAAKQTPRFKELQAQQVKAIETSGMLVDALGQKAKVPDFTLKNSKGKTINLYTELQKGPVILLWYQGGWNKYCTLTLRYFQAYAAEFKKYGALVLALAPEPGEKALLTQSRNKLTFDLLYDKDNAVANQFGIVYTLGDSLRQEYETRYALGKHYGNSKGELPLPAAYLVHPNGKVAYTFLNADYRRRVEPGDLLRVLKGMGFPAR